MSDRHRSSSPRAYYPLSSRSSPDPTGFDRYSRSNTPDDSHSTRYSISLNDISSVGNDSLVSYGRRDSLISCPSPRSRDFLANDNGFDNRSLSPSRRSASHEDIISSHKHVSKLQQDLMSANKRIGRMDVMYEETNRRKAKLQEELLDACTKVAKLEATCASFKEKEVQWQKDVMATQQRNSKLEMDVLSAFKKIAMLESELETVESSKNSVQQENVAARGKVSLLEAVIERMKQQRTTRNEDGSAGNQKVLELEARNEGILRENDELRQQLRRMRNKTSMVEDQLSKSLTEESNYNERLSKTKDSGNDNSVEILLNEVNKYKQLYENALKTNPENGGYKRLLEDVQKYKDQSNKAEEKLFAMLEYEVKYNEAKMKCEEMMVELNGAKRKLTLAEEQLQKALREKAAIAMDVGKTNNKNLKSQEALTTMQHEIDDVKRLLKDSERNASETGVRLQKVLKERQSLAEHCQELTKEMRESDAELEQVLALGDEMRGQLESMKGSLVDKDEQCKELMRSKDLLKEELEESSATLSQVQSELTRCKRQISEFKDNADIWEHKENEGVKRVKQLSLEVEDLTERLNKKTTENNELKNKLKCCHDDKEHVTEELETIQDKIVAMETTLNRVERERTGWEEKEIESSETINKQLSEIKRLKKELEEQKFEAENVFRRSQDEIMKAKQCSNEVDALETKCADLAGKLSEVERKYDAIVAERQELRREILKLKSDVAQLEHSLSMTNKENAELLNDSERANSLKNKQDGILMKVEKELMALKDAHEQLVENSQDDQVTLKKQTSELETCQERLEAKIIQVNELIERCELLKHERKQLREDLLNSKEQASSLQIQLDKELRERENLSDELNEAKKKIKRREDEIQNLESKLAEQADILEKGSRRSREEQGQMRIVKQELDIQAENFHEKCAELEHTKGKLDTLHQEYEIKKKEFLDLEATAAKLESQVNKLEREKSQLVSEVENRNSSVAKQGENVVKLQRQVKEIKEKLENSETLVDELRQINQKQSDENRVLFKQVGQKNSDCLELEASVKNLNSSKHDLIKSLKKLEEKCQDLEKQTEMEFREKLKLTEALKASEDAKERATGDASRLKEQVKEYKGLYEVNVKDAVVRRNSLEKKSLQNQELHKKYSKQAMKLSELETNLEEIKATNNRLTKDNFMKQTKITKVEELLQKTMQENTMLKATEQEAQQLLTEMNEDAEDYELEIQTLKVRICEQQAAIHTLEKTNSVLSKASESERVKESLKKLRELQKDHQTIVLEKDELESQLAEANEIIGQGKTQEMELISYQQRLKEAEARLSNIEIQYSITTKENSVLKENIVRLEDSLRVSETVKDKLKSELKQAQKCKKPGYSRGGLFIGNEDANAKPEGKASMKFAGPQTSTPLTSPRGSVHSKSFEIPAPKQRVLKRHYSLDSFNLANSNRGVSTRLSTSLDNLRGGCSRDHDITPEELDTSYDSFTGSEYSVDPSEIRALLKKPDNGQPLEDVFVGTSEDWETVSGISSVVTADTQTLTDQDPDIDVDQSDNENVKELKQRFEQAGVRQPTKLRRRSSSLTRTTSLTTLVEKHEEAASGPEVAASCSKITRNGSDEDGKETPLNDYTKHSDVKTGKKISDDLSDDKINPPHENVQFQDRPAKNSIVEMETSDYGKNDLNHDETTTSDHDAKFSSFVQNIPDVEIIESKSKDKIPETSVHETLSSPGEREAKNRNMKSISGIGYSESTRINNSDPKTRDKEAIVSDPLPSPDNVTPSKSNDELMLVNLLDTDKKTGNNAVCNIPATPQFEVEAASTEDNGQSFPRDLWNLPTPDVFSPTFSENFVTSADKIFKQSEEAHECVVSDDSNSPYCQENIDSVRPLNSTNDGLNSEKIGNEFFVPKTESVVDTDVKIVSETSKTDVLTKKMTSEASELSEAPHVSVPPDRLVLSDTSGSIPPDAIVPFNASEQLPVPHGSVPLVEVVPSDPFDCIPPDAFAPFDPVVPSNVASPSIASVPSERLLQSNVPSEKVLFSDPFKSVSPDESPPFDPIVPSNVSVPSERLLQSNVPQPSDRVLPSDPSDSVPSNAVVPPDLFVPPDVPVHSNSSDLPAESKVLNTNCSTITDVAPIIAEPNPQRDENKLSQTDTPRSPESFLNETETKEDKTKTLNNAENSDVKVKVKHMKSLWEGRENRNIDSERFRYKRSTGVNALPRQASPVTLRSLRTVSSLASNVRNDGDEGSGDTSKPAKVSELVSLWNKF